MPKVSVIVAVYNVEPYIAKCLHSLFGQSLDDIEYIFVDDGSSDKSVDIIYDILESYPSRAARTKILRHECNKGVAAARTTAILAASGEYMIHCDPDDYVETDMYEKLYRAAAAAGADIATCNHCCERDGRTYVKTMIPRNSPQEYLRRWFGEGQNYAMLCDKLIRREIFVRNGILPYAGIDAGEDFGCVARVLYYAKSTVHVPETLYHYCNRKGSITMRAIDREAFGCRLRLAREICDFFRDKGFDGFCNNLKFDMKLSGRHLFDGREEEWFGIFPECHAHVMSYRDNSFKSRVLWLAALRSVRSYKIAKKYIPMLG